MRDRLVTNRSPRPDGAGATAFTPDVVPSVATSDAWLRLVTDALHGYVYTFDVATGLVERSASFATVMGWPVDAAAPTAEWWLERVHPGDVARVRREMEAAMVDATCQQAECVYRAQRRDGTWIWVSDRQRFLRDARGVAQRTVGVAHDVTARVRAEETLRERESVIAQQLAQLEAIYQHAPVGLCVFDRDLRYLRINERLAEWNGLPVAAHLGRTVREIVPDLAPALEAFARQVLATGEPLRDLELAGETAAEPGRVRHWLEQWFPLFDGRGTLVGLNVVVEEVTDRRAHTAALAASEARHRLATEVTGLGTWTWDLRTGAVTADVRAAALFGLAPATSWPRLDALAAHVHPADRDAVAAALARATDPAGDGRYQAEFRVVRPDGTTRWARAAGQRHGDVAAAEGPAVVVGAVLDVTDAHAREDAVRAAAEAERQAREAAERAAHRLARLQHVAAALSPALSPTEVADVIMHEGFAALEAWGGGIVELVEEAPGTAAYATLSMRGYPAALETLYARFPADVPLPAGDVYRTRTAVFVESLDAWIARYGTPPSVAPVGRTVAECAWAALPLLVDGRLLGALTLCFAGRGGIDEADRGFMASLAHHCAQALARARAYEALRASEERLRGLVEAERAARAQAEATGRREAQLQRVTAALSGAMSVEEVARTVIRAGRETFGAIAGNLLELVHPADAAPHVRVVAAEGFAEEVLRGWDGAALSMRSPMTEAMREGRVVWYARSADRAARWGHPTPPGYEAAALVPVFLDDRVVGGWSLAFGAPRTFSEEDCAFLITLGRQAALAMERAWLFAAERTARVRTERLQALTAALGTARTVDDVARIALDEGARATGLTHGTFALLDAAATTFTTVRVLGHGPEVHARWRTFPNAPHLPAHAAFTSRAPLVLRASDAGAATRYPDIVTWSRAHGIGGHALFPLLATPPADADDATPTVIGLLTFELAEGRELPEGEQHVLRALAAVTAQALERVRLTEAERAAREAAEAASRAKSEFLAVMSHELRTPLNAIGGYTELIELGIRGPVTEEQRADLARIQHSQRHLLGLINQVLNYARVDAGALQYALVDVAVDEALASAEALVLPQMRARGLAFGCDGVPTAAGGGRLAVRADREKLQQVLLNLLSNAIKFTEPGGAVHVRAEADGARVHVAITDTGVGIPAEKLPHIFDPFVQADQRLTRPHDGVGLGLAISRELARGMDGDLTVVSAPGAGSTFTLTLPAA